MKHTSWFFFYKYTLSLQNNVVFKFKMHSPMASKNSIDHGNSNTSMWRNVIRMVKEQTSIYIRC